jgi:hypothetical protein
MQTMTVWLPTGTIRYSGSVGDTAPTVSLSRMTVRLAGFKIPLMDTLSDPFRFETEVLLEVVFAVLFTPGSGVVAVGRILIVVVVFSACFVVVVMQPAATISPTAINRENGTISFMGGLLHDVCFFLILVYC